MFAFVFEVLLEVLLRTIGHTVVYVCTLGKKRGGDDLATIIGVGFILALLLLIVVVVLRG